MNSNHIGLQRIRLRVVRDHRASRCLR
jgi:hypothetical protein